MNSTFGPLCLWQCFIFEAVVVILHYSFDNFYPLKSNPKMLEDENRQMQVHSKETRMETKVTSPLFGGKFE